MSVIVFVFSGSVASGCKKRSDSSSSQSTAPPTEAPNRPESGADASAKSELSWPLEAQNDVVDTPLGRALANTDNKRLDTEVVERQMDRGLARILPHSAVLYSAATPEGPNRRIVVHANGTVRWSIGEGPYWDKHTESGLVELPDKYAKPLARAVRKIWPGQFSMAASGRPLQFIVLRHGDKFRLVELKRLPKQLAVLDKLLRDVLNRVDRANSR